MSDQETIIADPESERALIAGCLHDSTAYGGVRDRIPPEYFSNPRRSAIWQVLGDLDGEDIRFGQDEELVAARIRASDLPAKPDVLGEFFLIAEDSFTAQNVSYHADVVVECYQKRTFRKQLRAAVQLTEHRPAKFPEILEEVESSLARWNQKGPEEQGGMIGDILHDDLIPMLAEERRSGGLSGVPTGLETLDAMTGGLKPGELIIVGGRPSSGKTAFAVQVAVHAAENVEGTVIVVSMEMAPVQVARRGVAAKAGTSYGRLGSEYQSAEELQRTEQAIRDLSVLKLIIRSPRQYTAAGVRATVRAHQRKHGKISVVLVDYLQFMKGEQSSSRTKNDEVTKLSSDLKELARQENVPVILLSQLNREVEKRPDKRPMLADLRDSGSIEQDADVVILVANSTDEEERGSRDSRLIVAKNRNGRCGDIPVVWDGETMTFQEPERYGVAV